MTTRIPSKEITGPCGALVRMFSKRMFGRVPESLGVMWHNLPVMKASMGFGQKLQKWDQCDETLKSFAHMAVASYLGCSWCLDFNYFMASNHGLDVERAREVPRWRTSDVFTPLEREVLAYAEIAAAVDKSQAAVRQVANRARGHVAARRPRTRVDRTEQQHVVERFVRADHTHLCHA